MCVQQHEKQQNCVQEKIGLVIENRLWGPKALMFSINETEIRKAYYRKRLAET
jgi:hypothetical protein